MFFIAVAVSVLKTEIATGKKRPRNDEERHGLATKGDIASSGFRPSRND